MGSAVPRFEGWHGRPYGKPLGKTREYVEIVRKILAREAPLEHDGAHYQIPYQGPDATGLGKPLKINTHPQRENMEIYLASIGPKNVTLTAEIADGWLPVFYSPDKADAVYRPLLNEGFARSGDSTKADRFDVAPTCSAIVTDDPVAARRKLKPNIALYVGGMGAKGKNFYNDLACRYGYEQASAKIQELYLGGKKLEAVSAVPDELVDETNLIGTPDMIRDRLDAWKDSGLTTLIMSVPDVRTLRTLAELVG